MHMPIQITTSQTREALLSVVGTAIAGATSYGGFMNLGATFES